MPQLSLSNRFLKGAVWLSISQVIAKVMSVIRVIAIAHLIPQGEVGLFAFAIVVMQLVEVLGQTGVGAALIQRPGDVRPYGGTVFVAQVVRGLILGSILCVLAPVFESFFDKPGLRAVLISLSVFPVLGGLRNVELMFLEREMKFAIPASIDLTRSVIDLVVSIAVAWFWPTVWALVIGQLSTYFISTALSYVLISSRVEPSFRWSYFFELSRFGFWVVVSTILAYFMVTGGQFVVAKLLSAKDVATYQIAYMLGCTPTAELCRVITRVSFSAFSAMQSNQNRAIDAHQQVFAVTCFWVTLVIGVATLAASGAATMFPPGYELVATVLPWLALWGASRALADVDGSLLQAMGKPSAASMVQFVTFVAMFAATIPLCHFYGIQGVAWGLGGVAIGSQLLRTIVLAWVLGISGWEAGKGLMIPATAALLAGFVSEALVRSCLPNPSVGQAAVVSLLFGTLYFAVWLSIDWILGTMYSARLRRLLRLGN